MKILSIKTIPQKICSLILSAILACFLLPVRAEANFEIPGSFRVQADAGDVYTVKTLDYSYGRNTYFSLRDIAMVLKDTDKSFSLEITKNSVSLNPENTYTPVGVENDPWKSSKNPDVALRRNEYKVGGQEAFYYTLIVRLPSGHYDCFMMAADLAMVLDVNITVPAAGSLQIHTKEPFSVSPDALEQAGYFYGANSVLVGDATTGELYYQYQSDIPYPIASVSKLMTCVLVMDAIAAGQIAPEDLVTVSDAAQELSASDDGIVSLTAGEQIPVRELLLCSLLPSSNECTLCLAEAVAGSEEAFVRMMNQKARELGLSQAVFFNCHGLPLYTEEPVPSKLQNRMSAEELFRLTAHLLRVYPQVTEITSLKEAEVESLDLKIKNTNPLLYNLPGVTGLKTGSTNKAGGCLAASLTVEAGGVGHNLAVIVLGTENSIERARFSGLLAKYALQAFYAGPEDQGAEGAERTNEDLPTHAEVAVDQILRTANRERTFLTGWKDIAEHDEQ